VHGGVRRSLTEGWAFLGSASTDTGAPLYRARQWATRYLIFSSPEPLLRAKLNGLSIAFRKFLILQAASNSCSKAAKGTSTIASQPPAHRSIQASLPSHRCLPVSHTYYGLIPTASTSSNSRPYTVSEHCRGQLDFALLLSCAPPLLILY
jgi:hypothetical protein